MSKLTKWDDGTEKAILLDFDMDEWNECVKNFSSDVVSQVMLESAIIQLAEYEDADELNVKWIPVSTRVPNKDEYENTEEHYYKRLLIAYMTDTIEYKIGYFDGYKWFDKGHNTIINVIAWKVFEPFVTEFVETEVLKFPAHGELYDQCGNCKTFVSRDSKICGGCGAKLNRGRCDKFRCINCDCCKCDNPECIELGICRSCIYKDGCEIAEDE